MQNAYVLLGGPEKSMEDRLRETREKLQENFEAKPLFFVTGTKKEAQFYDKKLQELKSDGIYYIESNAYDTLTNFLPDIKKSLQKHLKKTQQEGVNLIIISGVSHAQRIKKITKLLKKDETFKKCTFQVVESKKVFEPKSEIIAKILYKFGKIGIYTSKALSYTLHLFRK